jgi:hypothetical protein
MRNNTQQVVKSDRHLLAAQYVTVKINGTY